MEITLTTTIDIPDSVLEDVLTTAVEGGINYWATCTNVERREDLRVRYVRVHDDDGNSAPVAGVSVARGIRLLHEAIQTGKVHPNSEIGAQFLHHLFVTDQEDDGLGYTDAVVADAIVQMACFGELIYG